jgi:hypothetical protein
MILGNFNYSLIFGCGGTMIAKLRLPERLICTQKRILIIKEYSELP